MSETVCPYLVREAIAYRESLDVSRDAATRVVVVWRCTHPFHGIQLELGNSLSEIQERCAVCTLPRAEEEPGAQRPRRRARRDAAGS